LRQIVDSDFAGGGNIESNSLLTKLADEFEADPAWAEAYWSKFKYIFIDEFQDVQPLLFRFLRPGLEGRKFFLIGDDRQAIYRFMGSSPYFIQHLEELFPGTKRFVLKKNYRSNDSVVEVSQQMVPVERERYVSHKGGREPVHLIWVDDEAREAAGVLRYVRHHVPEQDLMILSRYRPDKPDNDVNVAYSKLKGKKDRFLSCHSSKGLEAAAVLVTGVAIDKANRRPFPAKDSDDWPVRVLKQIQMNEPQTLEEARLLYVALSRAKNHLFIVSERGGASPFLKQLKGLTEVDLAAWVRKVDEAGSVTVAG
jgi:superfamily I DNA/RNA helicase